jgi:hypothetical protein
MPAIGSDVILAMRLASSRRDDSAQTGSLTSRQATRTSATVRPAAFEDGRASSEAATRWASRLVPRSVLLIWVGRPAASRPVKIRISQTPGWRSRIVATDGDGGRSRDE